MTSQQDQPLAVFQTVWPAFPLTLPYNVLYPSYVATDCTGWMVPSQSMPCFHSRVIDKQRSQSVAENSATYTTNHYQRHKENRKFFLDKSVFDLVDAHPYLSLTDPKLLSWYLRLSAEDRNIILDEGGFHQFLQRHPALELSTHHVSVNYATGSSIPVQPTITSNKYRSKKTAATACKSADTPLELEMLPSNMRENLALLGCSYTTAGPQAANQVIHLQDGCPLASASIAQEPSHQKAHYKWNEASSASAAVQDPAALASFSLDVELQRRSQRGNPELTSQLSVTQRENVTYAEGSPLASTIENMSPEYYSFDSTQKDGGEYNNRSMGQALYYPLGPDDESSTTEEHQDYMVCGNVNAVDNNEGSSSSNDQSSIFHSIMEEDKGILVCLASEGQKTHNDGVHTGPVSTCNEALTDTKEAMSPVQSHVKINTSEKSTSTVPCVTTCDIMVATEVTPSTSASTQSECPETADRNIITEVHMADLDYLAGEFIKIRTAQQKLREQKEKMKISWSKLKKECDCAQRAQRAELSLLALQYNMCRQHCWRLYYTSAEGIQLTAPHGDMNQYWPKEPPANIVSVLQKLESDYHQMRDKILAGVPLEHLKPLTVDSEKMMAGAGYTPAQIIGDTLENLPSCSLKPQEGNTTGEEHGGPRDQSSSGCQDGQVKKENKKQRRAATLVPQLKGANYDPHKPEEMQTRAGGKEANMSEAWYDAEEDLEPEKGQDPTVITHDQTSDSTSDEAQSSVLCVSNLPSNVTDSDVMLWFDKYCPSEVCVSVLKTGLRVAIVMVNGAQSAEAAVRGLNGFTVEGRTLYVEHITGAVGRGRSQTSASVSESSQDQTKPQPPKTDSSSTERKVTSLSSSVKHRKVVCISPTAKGTCVPQHFGTMGSFDTLMSELTQLHPDVGRQRIVDALVELRSRHQGVLSGLPLKTIREMTSDLLTRPANATQL